MHLLSQLLILSLLMKPLCETWTLFLCLFFHLLVQCHYYLFLYDCNDSSMRTSSQSGARLDKQRLIDEHQVKLHFTRVGGEGRFGNNLHQAIADGKRKQSMTCNIRCLGRQPAAMFGIEIANEADVTTSHPRQAGQNLIQIISNFLRITVRRTVGSNDSY